MNTEQVYAELHTGITAFVRRRVRNPADADDIVQRVFLQVHRGLEDLRDDERLHGWIYRAARNAIVDHYRAAAPRREVPSGDATDVADLSGVRAADVEDPDDERAAMQELARCVRPLLEQLAAQDAAALQLTDLEGVTQSEAARRLNLSVSGMKSRVQRARGRLRSAFEACCRLQFDARGAVREFDQPAGSSCQPSCGPRVEA